MSPHEKLQPRLIFQLYIEKIYQTEIQNRDEPNGGLVHFMPFTKKDSESGVKTQLSAWG